MARAKAGKKPKLPPEIRALMTLRKMGDSASADYVVVFRLRQTAKGIEVVDSDYAHWTEDASEEPPAGMFEAVAKWIRGRFFAAWGEDIGTHAVQVAVTKGLEALIGPKPGG